MFKKLFLAGLISTSTLSVWTLPVKAAPCRDIAQYPYTNCAFPGSGGGFYENSDWEVGILHYEEGWHLYKGRDKRTGNSLSLDTSEIIGTTNRRQYVFRNGNYRYIVTVQPSDPNVIRLEVYQGSRVLLNQLLYRTGNAGCCENGGLTRY